MPRTRRRRSTLHAGILAVGLATLGLVPAGPGAPAPEGDDGREAVLVANKGEATLGFVDPAAMRQVASVPESGVTGHEVVVSPDGKRAFVPIYGTGGVGGPGTDGRTMDVFDVATRRCVATVDFGEPVRPHDAAFGPDGLLYVTNELTRSIAVVDPDSLAILRHLPTGQPESHMLALAPDGRRAYTSNAHAGTVSFIDVPAARVVAVVKVSSYAQRLALSREGAFLFTADQTRPRIAVIDTRAAEITDWIPTPGLAYGLATTADGRWLLATLPSEGRVAVVDLDARRVARMIPVTREPQRIAIDPGGGRAYVTSDSGTLSALDIRTWRVVGSATVGAGADGVAWGP